MSQEQEQLMSQILQTLEKMTMETKSHFYSINEIAGDLSVPLDQNFMNALLRLSKTNSVILVGAYFNPVSVALCDHHQPEDSLLQRIRIANAKKCSNAHKP